MVPGKGMMRPRYGGVEDQWTLVEACVQTICFFPHQITTVQAYDCDSGPRGQMGIWFKKRRQICQFWSIQTPERWPPPRKSTGKKQLLTSSPLSLRTKERHLWYVVFVVVFFVVFVVVVVFVVGFFAINDCCRYGQRNATFGTLLSWVVLLLLLLLGVVMVIVTLRERDAIFGTLLFLFMSK